MQDLDFLTARSIDEAIRWLSTLGDQAIPIAGGTAVVLLYRHRLLAADHLVNLAGIPDLDYVTYEPNVGLRIGALTTHRTVELSPTVRERLPFLADVFHHVANVRVRNQATVGGVLAEADYASDPPTALVALDAEVRAVGPKGERVLRVADLLRGYYETSLERDEILLELIVPAMSEDEGYSYIKYTSRSSEDRPCVGIAAVVRAPEGLCEDLRVVVGAVAPTPQRFSDVEQIALGAVLTEERIRDIAKLYADRVDPLSDFRGSAWYRRRITEVLVRRALLQAWRQK